jgi:hypothetical protein
MPNKSSAEHYDAAAEAPGVFQQLLTAQPLEQP